MIPLAKQPKTAENEGLPPWWSWSMPEEELPVAYQRVWQERTDNLRKMRGEAGRWEGLREHYAGSAEGCIAFINGWGVTYDPRNVALRLSGVKLPTMLPFLLFQRQADFIAWLHERWVSRQDGLVEKSRDMGISWCCIAFAVWMLIFHRDSVTGFGSYKEEYVDTKGDPKSLFWKARYLIDRLPHELKPKGYDPQFDAPYMRIMAKENGSIIFGEAGDNIGRGARASLYFKDESAHYQRAESIDAALSQTSNCNIDVSTPNGEGNAFWQKRFGGNVSVFVFDWRDDPRKGPAWYAVQQGRMTATSLAQEVDRDYSASITNSFIDARIVGEAQARGPADVQPTGPLRVGLDVARFGDDQNVLTFRRGRVLLKLVRWKKSDAVSTVGRTRQEILAFRQLPEQIAVDSIGVGGPVADYLRRFPGWEDIVQDVNSSLRMTDGRNYNLRAFMWNSMRDWLSTASIPNDTGLRAALTGLRFGYRAGEMLMESKDDAKGRGIRSPDEADSLALTFAYPGSKSNRTRIDPTKVQRSPVDSEAGM